MELRLRILGFGSLALDLLLGLFGLRASGWDLGIGELGSQVRGTSWQDLSGILHPSFVCPVIKTLCKNPLGIHLQGKNHVNKHRKTPGPKAAR